jgi:hypothetical protein
VASGGHHHLFDDYDEDDYYYEHRGTRTSAHSVGFEVSHVTGVLREKWWEFVEASGARDKWWGPILMGFVASYVPGSLRRFWRRMCRAAEAANESEVRPRSGSGRYNLALQGGTSGW